MNSVNLTHIWKSGEGWRAETNVKGVYNDTCLKISTYKSNRGLVTLASCYRALGGFERHEIYRDFYKVIRVTDTRCTEKAIEKQHDSVLVNLEELKKEVVAHYTKEVK